MPKWIFQKTSTVQPGEGLVFWAFSQISFVIFVLAIATLVVIDNASLVSGFRLFFFAFVAFEGIRLNWIENQNKAKCFKHYNLFAVLELNWSPTLIYDLFFVPLIIRNLKSYCRSVKKCSGLKMLILWWVHAQYFNKKRAKSNMH